MTIKRKKFAVTAVAALSLAAIPAGVAVAGGDDGNGGANVERAPAPSSSPHASGGTVLQAPAPAPPGSELPG